MIAGTGRTWAVVDVAGADGSPGAYPLRGELQGMIAGAMAAAGIPETRVLPGHPQSRLALEFGPGDLPASALRELVDELHRRLADRNRRTDRPGTLLVTCTLGVQPYDTAYDVVRIADAPVVERVRSSSPSSVPVVVLSETAHDPTPSAGVVAGRASHVRSGPDTFWITVPGRSVRGLRPADVVDTDGEDGIRPDRRPRRPRSGERTFTVNNYGNHYGNNFGDNYGYGGDNHYGGGS